MRDAHRISRRRACAAVSFVCLHRSRSQLPPLPAERLARHAPLPSFEAALKSYHLGLDAVRHDVTVHGVEMRLALHLNCAAALLKLERPHAALAACRDALALDARSAKALLRRAKAHIGVGSTLRAFQLT